MQVVEINKQGIVLSIRSGFLQIKENEEIKEIPLDNIDCLVLNSFGAFLTNQVLIRLNELNIPLIICGKNAVPTGILLSTAENVYRKDRLQSQLAASLPLQKNLWQSVIKAKIANQGFVLRYRNKPFREFPALEKKVLSGDTTNVEAACARKYWQRLFGSDFKRDPDEDGINSLLNYGYAIIRATFCRAISATGLIPELGIHHRNMMNPFCLADDLMEPYRPFMDNKVFEIWENGFTILNPSTKKELIQVLDEIIPYQKEESHVRFCIDKTVMLFANSLKRKKVSISYPIFDVKRI